MFGYYIGIGFVIWGILIMMGFFDDFRDQPLEAFTVGCFVVFLWPLVLFGLFWVWLLFEGLFGRGR